MVNDPIGLETLQVFPFVAGILETRLKRDEL